MCYREIASQVKILLLTGGLRHPHCDSTAAREQDELRHDSFLLFLAELLNGRIVMDLAILL